MFSQQEKPASPASSPERQPVKTSKGLACIFCQQRKVKCDRQRPCASCTKARVACTYRARQAPRRRHNKATEVSLRARLGRLEELLKAAVSKNDTADFPVEAEDISPEPNTSNPPEEDVDTVHMQLHNSLNLADDPKVPANAAGPMAPGQLVSGHGKSRYIENKLWNKIYEQLKDTQELLDEESSDEEGPLVPVIDILADPTQADLTFGTSTSASNLRLLHPHPSHIPSLLTAFLENMNPLTKVVHGPTTQKLVHEASQQLDSVSRGVNALLFAIYFAAVITLTDEDCTSMLGEPKATLTVRYKYAAQKALLSANYLRSSDLKVLQAFVIYLLAARPYYDSRTFWAFSGLAVRIAQRIGIHKDGSTYNLSPFEIEMRRRLWWQIMLIDVRAAEVSGAGLTVITLGDTKRPLNINDDDLDPNMLEAPEERAGTTDMCFVMLRSSIGRYFKYLYKAHLMPESQLDQLFAEEKKSVEDIMSEFENYLHENFLKNSDPLNPLQFFTSMVARAILCSWRVMDGIRKAADETNPNIQQTRDRLFEESLKGIEYDNLGHTTKSTQRFLWHMNSHFQWHSFIGLLGELRRRTKGELVEKAWQQVDHVFKFHSEILTTRNPLHTAIGNLAIAAWEARETDFLRTYQLPMPGLPPDYILALRRQRAARERSVDKSNSESPAATSVTNSSIISGGPHVYATNFTSFSADPAFDLTSGIGDFSTPSSSVPSDPTQMDWNVWDSLLQNYELPPSMDTGDFMPKDTVYGGHFQ